LVENQRRINFGNEFVEYKGLVDDVVIDGKMQLGWKQDGFNLKNISRLVYQEELPKGEPGFYRGYFNVDQVEDTFLNRWGLVKGVAFVNGFNIGRYWTIRPQLTLYVPRHLLIVGRNELVIFEQESIQDVTQASFDDKHQISII
jgi:beta-galactosidase